MLIYSETDNLTLDIFERIHISKLLSNMIECINYGVESLPKTVEKNNIALHFDAGDSDIIKVWIAISDNKAKYRIPAHKEKIFSSHINIYFHFFHFIIYDYINKKSVLQSLRTTVKIKQFKVLLGKRRIRHFKLVSLLGDEN